MLPCRIPICAQQAFSQHLAANLAKIIAIFIAALGLLTFAGSARAQQSKRLCVILNKPWSPTGVLIVQGETLTLKASGDMDWFTPIPSRGWRGCAPGGNCHTTPAGSACTIKGFLAQGLPCWSLIGRIGNGPIFPVGTSLANFTAPSSGELFLGVNDTPNDYFDNTGEWQAEISTSLPCVPAPSHDIACLKVYQQKQPVWCWAAAAEILMENSGAGWEHHEQCEQVEAALNKPAGSVCGAAGDNGFSVQNATPFDIGGNPQNSFAAYQFTSQTEQSPLSNQLGEWVFGQTTPAFLMNELGCSERPVGVTWTNGKSRHVMVVTGYETNLLGGGLVLHMFNPGIEAISTPAGSSGAPAGVVCMYSQTCSISYSDFLSPSPFSVFQVIYEVHKQQ